jgi:hypothetical protein
VAYVRTTRTTLSSTAVQIVHSARRYRTSEIKPDPKRSPPATLPDDLNEALRAINGDSRALCASVCGSWPRGDGASMAGVGSTFVELIRSRLIASTGFVLVMILSACSDGSDPADSAPGWHRYSSEHCGPTTCALRRHPGAVSIPATLANRLGCPPT